MMNYWVTPRLAAGTKWFDKLTILSKVEGLMGYPRWSRGPLLHRGEKRKLSPLVDHEVQTPWSILFAVQVTSTVTMCTPCTHSDIGILRDVNKSSDNCLVVN